MCRLDWESHSSLVCVLHIGTHVLLPRDILPSLKSAIHYHLLLYNAEEFGGKKGVI